MTSPTHFFSPTILPSRLLLCLAALLTLLLSGCATQAPSPNAERHPGDWSSQQDRLEAIRHWSIAGKVAIRTPDDSQSANLTWQRDPGHYRIMVSGPFGTGRNTLEGRNGNVTLTNGDGTFRAATPEALMEQRMGWSLPVSSLDYWVRGLPDPQGPHFTREDELGFPSLMQQNGWTIAYKEWTRAGGLWLPRRMIMDYGDLHAILVLNQWQLDNDTP